MSTRNQIRSLNWHCELGLISGSNNNKQYKKLFEEVIEMYMAINPGTTPQECIDDLGWLLSDLQTQGRIKTIKPENAKAELIDSGGDIQNALTNIMHREGTTNDEALGGAMDICEERAKAGGKVVNGTYIKEADL